MIKASIKKSISARIEKYNQSEHEIRNFSQFFRIDFKPWFVESSGRVFTATAVSVESVLFLNIP